MVLGIFLALIELLSLHTSLTLHGVYVWTSWISPFDGSGNVKDPGIAFMHAIGIWNTEYRELLEAFCLERIHLLAPTSLLGR